MTPAGGEQKRAKRKPSENPEADVEAPPKKESKSTEDLDKLIDEIDEVLEENAEEFVRSYVQKGGEAMRAHRGASSELRRRTWTRGGPLAPNFFADDSSRFLP
jgi:ubiquitin-like protein Pup